MSDPAYDDLLTTAAPLSEVRFVHDYVQLVVWPFTLSVYPAMRVVTQARVLGRTDAGYFDEICRLIGERITDIVRVPGVDLAFTFSNGTRLLVSLRPEDAVGPEILQMMDAEGGLMVERYDD